LHEAVQDQFLVKIFGIGIEIGAGLYINISIDKIAIPRNSSLAVDALPPILPDGSIKTAGLEYA